jgi:peptide/nickel transport system permease protein
MTDVQIAPVGAKLSATETSSDRPFDTGPRFRQRRSLITGAASWLSLVVFVAIFANVLPIANPDADIGRGVRTLPFHAWPEFLGTDSLGRSEISRLVYGARASLEVAVGSVVIALIIGLAVGVRAAYSGGWFDTAVGILTDSILAFPGLVLLLVLAAFLKPGTGTLVVGLSTLAFPNFARLARANGLRYKSAEFVEAARALGARTSTILLREVIPNVVGVLAAYAGVVTAGLVIAEASISFLGLGIQPPTPSWGNMINDGQQVLTTDAYLVLVPCVVLFLTVFSLIIVGDWFRARLE